MWAEDSSSTARTFWQQYVDPCYYERSLDKRILVAIHLASVPHGNSPERFRTAIAFGPIPTLALNIRNRCGRNLIHAVAQSIGCVTRKLNRCYGADPPESQNDKNVLKGDDREV